MQTFTTYLPEGQSQFEFSRLCLPSTLANYLPNERLNSQLSN